jgi:hypothetical protein
MAKPNADRIFQFRNNFNSSPDSCAAMEDSCCHLERAGHGWPRPRNQPLDLSQFWSCFRKTAELDPLLWSHSYLSNPGNWLGYRGPFPHEIQVYMKDCADRAALSYQLLYLEMRSTPSS